MPKEIKVIKSPSPEGVEKLPVSSSGALMTVNIMLPSGIVITNPEQFQDDEAEANEECEQ
jgi:hypothetical protein